MQHSPSRLEEIEAALQDVNNPSLPLDRRRATEKALLAWRQQDAAWAIAYQLLESASSPDLVLFAAQTLRYKINEQACSMEQTQLQQLRHLLLQQLRKPPAHVAPAVLRQLCLALADLVALLPAWADVITTAHTQLPQWHCIELLHSIAEEGSSDWRHVNVPGAAPQQGNGTAEMHAAASNRQHAMGAAHIKQQRQAPHAMLCSAHGAGMLDEGQPRSKRCIARTDAAHCSIHSTAVYAHTHVSCKLFLQASPAASTLTGPQPPGSASGAGQTPRCSCC